MRNNPLTNIQAALERFLKEAGDVQYLVDATNQKNVDNRMAAVQAAFDQFDESKNDRIKQKK